MVCDTKYGRMTVFRNDAFVSHSLHLYGEWCQHELYAIGGILTPGDIAIDVGANIGTHTLSMAAAVGPTGKVIAFEPQRKIYEVLCWNLAENQVTNVDARLAAVGAYAGTVEVPDIDLDVWENFAAISLAENTAGLVIDLTTIDDLEFDTCRLIKVDVEGMEVDVLKGGEDLIRRAKPALFVENNTDENSERLITAMGDLGYQIYWHLSPYFNAGNHRHESKNVFPEQVSVNVLGFHADWRAQVNGLQPVLGGRDTWRDAFDRARSSGQISLV